MKRQPPAPKFRAACEWCGQRSPRATTSWTTEKWMHKHEQAHAAAQAQEDE